MKRLSVPLLLILSLLLCGCSPNIGDTLKDSGVLVCRLANLEDSPDDGLFCFEAFDLGEGEIAFDTAIAKLNSAPIDTDISSVFPKDVRILTAKLLDGVAALNMNSAYLELSGIDETIADYGMVLTLCSIPGVSSVSILSGGELLKSDLTADDVVLRNTVISDREAALRLYFPRADGDGLGYEYRSVRLGSDDSPERRLMDELMAGPQSAALSPIASKDTLLLSISTQDKVCSVNFSAEFLSGQNEISDETALAVEAIISSLASLADVDSVRILINGKYLPTGNIVFTLPLPQEGA